MFSHYKNLFINFLLPPRCPWCKVLGELPKAQGICDGCLKEIQWSPGEWRSNKVPAHCDSIHAVALFQGGLRKVVHALKYDRKPSLAATCSTLMIPVARGLPRPDVVMAVPLNAKRLKQRRYNQSEWLARPIAAALQVPILTGFVQRSHSDTPQVGLGADARWENVREQFFISSANRKEIEKRHVLLIDDVVTTGATLQALARILKKNGAATVRALTLAQAL